MDQRKMLLMKSSYILLIIFLQTASIQTAPLRIIQAKPQIMKHTLQQPSPMETLQSVKAQRLNQDLQASTRLQQLMLANLQQQMATDTLHELAKIQTMQYASEIEMHPPDLMESWLPQMPMPTHPQNTPWQQQQQQLMMPMIQQMSEDAMQEIALQQQMLALQQMQAFNQLNAHSSYTYPQPEPVFILLPDEKTENSDNKIYKLTDNSNTHDNKHTAQNLEDEEQDSVIIESDETYDEPTKGTRKAIILVPNARISIGGIISQIPWLPIEVNVPDTAIWAWNGIYNGISNIISGIGSRWPWRTRPGNANTTEPSVKVFLKQLQRNDGETMPVYPMPMDAVIPVDFN